jgi:arylsulfatase A-like enzyme
LKEPRLAAELMPKAPPTQKAVSVLSATRLNLDFYTLGEAFKDAGYSTAHIGKWHLGPEPYDPLHQGFDIDIPHTSTPGPGGWIAPWVVWKGHGKPGDHLEEAMADEAVNYIKSHKDKPFLLDYWSFSVHAAWNAKKNLIDKYASLANSNDSQHNPVYAGMIETFDNSVGRIMQTLKEEGLLENTIIVFCSDNGGVNWAGGSNIPSPYNQIPITSNLPLRAGKATDYNGGVHVPLAVVWPGYIKGGSSNNTIVSGVDIYPTLLEMCRIKQKTGVEYDGISLVPALKNKKFKRGPIFFHFPTYIQLTKQIPATAVIDGDFKLIRDYCDNDDQTDRFELYNLKDDISEKIDLSNKMPLKVKELNKLITNFLNQSNAVIPKPNPSYRVGSQPSNTLPENKMPN